MIDNNSEKRICPYCGGKRWVLDTHHPPCSELGYMCDGSGYVYVNKEISNEKPLLIIH